MTITPQWSNLAIDDKINDIYAAINTLSRMVEDILFQLDRRHTNAPDPQKVLNQYRDKISAAMAARGADPGAISAFQELMNINLSDHSDQGTPQ